MAELSFIKTSNGLVPATEGDKETFDKWKSGRVITGKFSQSRNYEYHKRFFALMNLAFEYYEPTGGVLTMDEKRIAKKIFETMESYGNQDGTILAFGREFMKKLAEQRKSKITDIQKAFDPFRKEMIIEAGYFETVVTPTGVKKVAKSISFSSMDELEFRELYKAVFSTLWRFVLSRHFSTEEEAENAARMMLEFA